MSSKRTKYDLHVDGVYACSTWSRNRQGALASFEKAGRKWMGQEYLATRNIDQAPAGAKVTVSLAS